MDRDVWSSLPPVTRLYLGSTVSLMVLCSLDVVSPFSLYLNWHLVVREWQFWRLATCFLFLGEFGLSFFWNVSMLAFYCSSLEQDVFRGRSADFLWMLFATAAMLLGFSLVFGNGFFFSGAMINVMTYVWGRRNPQTQMSVFFFTVRAPYIPWVLCALSVLVGWHLTDHLMAIVVGHLYYFLEDVYPLMPTSNGMRIFKTPAALRRLLQAAED